MINYTPIIQQHVEMNLKTARNNLAVAKERREYRSEMYWAGKVAAYEGLEVILPKKNMPREEEE